MGSQRVSEETLHFHLLHKNKHLCNILFIENKHILFKVKHLLNLVFSSTTRFFSLGTCLMFVYKMVGIQTGGWIDRRQVGTDRMVRQHHRLNEHELERSPGDSWRIRKTGML